VLTLLVILALLAIAVVLALGLLVSGRRRRLTRHRRAAIAREEMGAEQRLQQLTQEAVARMLEAARRGRQ